MNYFWPGSVNTHCWPGLVNTNLVPGRVNTNWGPGPVNTNLVPGVGPEGRRPSKEPGAGKYKYRILGKLFFFAVPVYLFAVVFFLV